MRWLPPRPATRWGSPPTGSAPDCGASPRTPTPTPAGSTCSSATGCWRWSTLRTTRPGWSVCWRSAGRWRGFDAKVAGAARFAWPSARLATGRRGRGDEPRRARRDLRLAGGRLVFAGRRGPAAGAAGDLALVLHVAVVGHRRAVARRGGAMLAALQLLPDIVGVVNTDHHHVAGMPHIEGVARRLELIEHRLDAGAAGPGVHTGAHAPLDQRRRVAARAATGVGVLANDDRVEMVRRDPAQLDDVLVAPVAGGGHHPDAASGDQRLPAAGRGFAEAIHEIAERLDRGGIVGVVHDHAVPVELEHVEPARRHEVAGGEGAQPLADVVEVRADGPRRARRREGILDVHSRSSLEGRGEPVR